MSGIAPILFTAFFLCAVLGLTFVLTRGTKRDADRWLVDRRVSARRKQASSGRAEPSERRHGDRRLPEHPGRGD